MRCPHGLTNQPRLGWVSDRGPHRAFGHPVLAPTSSYAATARRSSATQSRNVVHVRPVSGSCDSDWSIRQIIVSGRRQRDLHAFYLGSSAVAMNAISAERNG